MKKNAFLLLVVIISIILSGCLFSSKYDPESDFTTYNIGRWVRRDGNIVQIVESIGIAGYAGTKTDVRIPPRINRLPVTTIGQGAFRGKELTSVTIPNSVTRIQGAAF
ncbi:MAG: leucine-rich repeat domain-containing protein, partial [Spirochaetes bacterium]|nr:leucine-rich repeat domain-containing protein [Spirochaetota bacterium]